MQKFIFLIASIIAIIINTTDIYKLWGGKSITEISDTTKTTIITPDGFTFAIWGVIFLMFIIIGVANIRYPKLLSQNTIKYFVGSMISISLWVVFFTLQVPFLQTILLFSILFFNILVTINIPARIRHFYLIYTSWTTIASVLSVTVMLQYDIGIKNILGIPNPIISSVVLGIGVGLFVVLAKYFQSVTPLLVGAWAYIGIFRVSEQIQPDMSIKSGAIGYALILSIIAIYTIYQNKNLLKKLNH
jgi:hypothetical protein